VPLIPLQTSTLLHKMKTKSTYILSNKLTKDDKLKFQMLITKLNFMVCKRCKESNTFKDYKMNSMEHKLLEKVEEHREAKARGLQKEK
jgi:predicted metal-binding protein